MDIETILNALGNAKQNFYEEEYEKRLVRKRQINAFRARILRMFEEREQEIGRLRNVVYGSRDLLELMEEFYGEKDD
jgi:hypothetical protein